MRIRGKLICAFLIITLIPIVLLCGTGGVIYTLQMEALPEMDGEVQDVAQVISNPVQIMNRMTEKSFKQLREISKTQPEYLEDTEYLKQWNEELQWKYSFLVVKKEDTFHYIGNEKNFEILNKKLPSVNNTTSISESGTYIGGEEPFLVKQHTFRFKDGNAGTLFVVTRVNGFLPGVRSIILQLIFSFLIIICFTASLLTLWIYRGMVRPINVLKKATHKMRDGDLDFSIKTQREDEIGMLCKDFEEMRVRLKESIEMRLISEREMRELVSNISHDLKTPLTAIEGYTEGIMDGVADTPEKQEKYLKIIHKKAKEMAMLVDELSMCSKIENGIVPYNFRYISVAEYFGDCVQEISMDLDIQNISVEYTNEVDKDVRVEMDPEQLKRVINNIVGNSMKFIEADSGTISIEITEENGKNELTGVEGKETERSEKTGENIRSVFGKKDKEEKKEKPMEPGMIQVEFRDTGKGIATENLPHVFDRFYRADAARQSSKGSGLGLAISKKIIEDHGGRIWAESEEGVGTSIFFTLRKEMVEKEK